MGATPVQQVRSFNRCVTQAVGALNDHYLGRDRPLGESRLLFEIGSGGATASDLRSRLGLDSGYLSRLLRSLEARGLITTVNDAQDKRVRRARPTPAGVKELEELNSRSDQLAQSILEPLNAKQRAKLVDAMAEVERLLSASAVRIDEEPPTSPDASFCLTQYFGELADRFDHGFDPALSLAAPPDEFAPPRGTFLVMRLWGEPVGCGGFKPMAPDSAYLKRMWIAPAARGLGLAKTLLSELELRARLAGYRFARLETNRTLAEAQQLYRSSGYVEVSPFNDEPYAHHWFEKPLR
jgi:DNA-binding MarR family transcriptional regulator/GNAT superfamily N-acetyltransferase